MAKRKIITIDHKKCNGCGKCIPQCPEGAIQIIGGKARLVGESFCDGLGACIGFCPEGAITIEEREVGQYDEAKVMANILPQGGKVIKAHLEHLSSHNQQGYLREALDYLREKGIRIEGTRFNLGGKTQPCSCPGSKALDLSPGQEKKEDIIHGRKSDLGNWPLQIVLVPEGAQYLNNADLLLSADCVPFSYADFHNDLLTGKVLLVGCPKLDDAEFYQEKLTRIFKNNNIKSLTCVRMEVPCCYGLTRIVKSALENSGKDLILKEIIISIKGEKSNVQ